MIGAVAGPFAEALRATIQPCTFLLIVPVTTAVVAARATWQALVGAVSATVLGGWILLDNRWILEGAGLRLSAVVVLLVLAVLAVLAVPRLRDSMPAGEHLDAPRVQAALVGGVSLIATLWWRPCVGSELGTILNRSQDGLGAQLVPMAAYMLGALFPAATIVALRYAVQPSERWVVTSVWLGALIGGTVAASLVAGQHDEVVVALTRWTVG